MKTEIKANEKKQLKKRVVTVGILFALFYMVICGKAVYLQVFRGSWLSKKAAEQYNKSLTFKGKRGAIYDRNHRELALSVDVTSVAAYPKKISDPVKTAKALAKELDMDHAGLYRKLSSKRNFVWVKRQISPKESARVKEIGISGMDFISEHNRFYPNRNLAAQVLGFTGTDGRGLEGLEFFYDSLLGGNEGEYTMLKDAHGRGIVSRNMTSGGPDYENEPSIQDLLNIYSGKNLILTIDESIQYIAEKELRRAVTTHDAKSGLVVVMAPFTGEILSIAHYPFFNPNVFSKSRPEDWRNRAVTDAFEPGSTMKIFTAAAALESGICKPENRFYCEKGRYRVGDYTIHDIKRSEWLTLSNIIRYSSNIGIVKVAETIGPEIMYNNLKNFGFGEKTGIDSPGETTGILADYRRWSKIDQGTIAYGHGISVSAVQLITAVSAIANGGVLMKPYLVQAVIDHTGEPVKRNLPKERKRVLSPETAVTLKHMMQAVIEKGGTGEKAQVEGFMACGKTGTAQKLDENGGYSKEKYLSSFVGFAPMDKPEITVLVVINEPKGDYYGGLVAAPVFQKVVKETLHYLNVPPRIGTDRLTASFADGANG